MDTKTYEKYLEKRELEIKNKVKELNYIQQMLGIAKIERTKNPNTNNMHIMFTYNKQLNRNFDRELEKYYEVINEE